MRTLYLAASLLLLASIPCLAQVRGTPATVTSSAPGQRMGSPASFGPPASVTSLGPNGWGARPNGWGGASNNWGARPNGWGGNGWSGRGRFGDHDRDHDFRGHRDRRFCCGFGFGYSYPVYGYYPSYYYPYGSASYFGNDPYAIYDPYADPRPSYPITYDTGDQGPPPPVVPPSVDDEPPLPTDGQRVRDSDRYGDHYTDARERSRSQQDSAPQQQAMNQPPPPRSNPDSYPATTLVFKDGRQVELHNYAIVGDFVFDLAEGRARKYRISDLDLPATMRLNDDNGVTFHLPHEPAPGQ